MAVLPSFSIRHMLIAMVGLAMLSACLAGAYRGNLVFYGLFIGTATMIGSLFGLAATYWLALLIAKMVQMAGSPSTVKEKLIWMAILFGSLLNTTTTLMAQPTLPSGKSGYTVTVDNQYPSNGTGYRTVRIRLETDSKLPVKKDLNLRASIKTRDYYANSHGTLSVPMILQSGQSATEAELYLLADPLYGNQSSQLLIEKDVFDGRFDPRRDICVYELGGMGFNSQSSLPSIMFVSSVVSQDNGVNIAGTMVVSTSPVLSIAADAEIPSFDKLYNCFDLANGSINRNGSTSVITNAITAISMETKIHAVHPAELPQDWVGLSGVDEIVISFDELKLLASTYELRRQTLQQWVAAGGTLIVFDSGPAFERADQVPELLLGAQRVATLDKLQPSWREPSPELLQINRPIVASTAGYPYNRGSNLAAEFFQVDEVEVALENRWIEHDSLVGLATESKFLVSQHVNGSLVVVRDTMQNWSESDWRQLQNGIRLAGKSMANQLGGMTGTGRVLFKIPGIGEPPVMAFQILIGAFILLAGPGIYIVLARSGQMQLFFMLVPLLSLTVCLGLVGYATFVDGFESWGRVQSVTWVDHRIESAVTQSRCSYFCGTQPGSYRFSGSIVPFVSTSNNSRDTLMGQSRDGLTIAGGDIRSRTPHQVVATRSYQFEPRLRWLPPPDVADGANGAQDLGTFRNQLGSPVLLVVARTEAGWVFVENLAIDQSLPAQATSLPPANTLLRELAKDLPLSTYLIDRQRYYGQQNDTSYGSEFEVILTLQNGKGTDCLTQVNTYIAILESFPIIDAQIEPVQYKKQLHVIIGKW